MNISDLDLLIEALERAASRLESYARFNPRNARTHDDKAAAMRKLRNQFVREKVDRLSGESVQCPHCKWGFFPSVVDQHIREKHGGR